MEVFTFRKSRVWLNILFVILISAWIIFIFKTNLSLSFLLVLFIVLLLNSSITEIHLKQNEMIIKNIFKISFHITYQEILFFGKGWGNSIIYIAVLKKKIIPLFFQSRGEIPERVIDVLRRLEEKTNKKINVIF